VKEEFSVLAENADIKTWHYVEFGVIARAKGIAATHGSDRIGFPKGLGEQSSFLICEATDQQGTASTIE
jgi:hypothetical protein